MNAHPDTAVQAGSGERSAADALDAALGAAGGGDLAARFGAEAADLVGLAHALVTSDSGAADSLSGSTDGPAPQEYFVAALEARLEEAFDAHPVPVARWRVPARSRLAEVVAVGVVAAMLAAGAFLMTSRDEQRALATVVAATETATPTESVRSAAPRGRDEAHHVRAGPRREPAALVAALPADPRGTPAARGMP